MSTLTILVPGEPVPKGRPRVGVGKRGDGSTFPRVFTPAATVAYEKTVRTLAQIAVNQTRWQPGPSTRFRVLVTVFRTHEGKGGDADNYLKAALDACNGVAFPDDRYVRELAVVLRQDRERPRMKIEISEVA